MANAPGFSVLQIEYERSTNCVGEIRETGGAGLLLVG